MFKLSLQRIPVATFSTSPLIRETLIPIKTKADEQLESSRSALIKYIETNESFVTPNKFKLNDFSKNLRVYWSHLPSSSLQNNPSSILSKVDCPKFILFTKQRWQSSPLVRSLFMRELICNCTNTELINKLITLLEVKLPDPLLSTPLDVLKWCINKSLHKKDVVTAIDLFLLFYKVNTEAIPQWDYAKQLISALKYQHPRYDNIHLKKLTEVIQLLKKHRIRILLSNFDVSLLCNKALSPDVESLVSKNVLGILLDSQLIGLNSDNLFPSQQEMSVIEKNQLKLGYTLIDKDYKIRNQTGVHLAWIQIKDIYPFFSDHDSRILYKVFESSCQNRAYRDVCVEMLKMMNPEKYCNDPLLISAIIKYVSTTRSLKQARSLMTNMEKFTTPENKKLIWASRRFLSSLLRMQLVYFEAESVDNIIKQITETYGSLSASDYAAIVSHLLSKPTLSNIKRALQFVDSVPLDRRFSSYIVLLNKLTETVFSRGLKLKPLVMPLINEILIKAHEQDPEHYNRIWSVTSAIYVKTILLPLTTKNATLANNTDTSALDLAKLLYCKNEEGCIPSSDTTTNPFLESHPTNIKLKINDTNRFVILRNIAHISLKCARKDIFLWSCTQLYREGMPVEELIFLWNMTFKHQFRKNSYHSKFEIKQALDKHGIQAFENLLQ
ncbi:cytochrome B pre-mRNA-processing protein 1 [Monosporozyma unispora]